MAGRSITSRVNMMRQAQLYAKRNRDLEDTPATEQRLEAMRVYKRARANPSSAVSRVEEEASVARLRATLETASRNAVNQKQTPFRQDGVEDEDRFFAEIDAPMTTVCGGCGERVAPAATKTIAYDPTDTRFQLLAVKTVNGTCSRGLVEAGVVRKGSQDIVTFCQRCNQALKRGQLPVFTEASGFKLSPVPPCLGRLNPMEARMIGIGICFTTCYSLGGMGQSATRGNSINFWNDTYDIILKLPRPSIRCGVIRLSKPGAQGPATYYNVRPWYLREAIDWLKANNPIYKEVIVDDDLCSALAIDEDVLDVQMDDEEIIDSVDNTVESGDNHNDSDDTFAESFALGHELDCEREDEKVMHALEGVDTEHAYVLPRSETPINEYSTKLLMQCCFPTIFPDGLGGFHGIDDYETRSHTYKLAEYCAHLMAWHDRRFIMHPTFKFFCLNIIQRRQVDGLLKQINVRPHLASKTSQTGVEAHDDGDVGNARTKAYLRELKPFFRAVRGTGLYWANVRDDLMSMIGNPALETKWPTFFVTLSAADTVWPDFFRACDPRLSFEEAASLSPSRKRQLLNANPDIAAHHFHRRFQAFFRHILCGKSKPLGEIVDFFWRVEFQRRGSPHIHALLWVSGAPDIVELSKTDEGREQLRIYADKFVSCLLSQRREHSVPATGSNDPLCQRPPPKSEHRERLADLYSVVERVQQHVCSTRSSCQRGGKCRFDFPKTIQPTTEIKRDVSEGSIKITIEHRRDNDATNNYNPEMLSAWRANMDVKIIGNAYGAAEYTAAYVSKAEPDSVRFFKTIEKALQTLPTGVPKERVLKRTANTLLAMREVSAQEAVYILSNTLCLYGKSRSVVKVKVSRHKKRYYRVELDALAQRERLHDTASELRVEAMETAYMKRPSQRVFTAMCYRNFCETYEISSDGPRAGQKLARWQLQNGHGFIKAMTKKQAIRPSPHYRSNEQDPDYCYAQLFLYKPWRALDNIPTEDDAILRGYQR